jgi:hypothetical protein
MNSSIIDPWTKEPFIPKRTNQLFENRKNQISFNNLLAYRERLAKRDIDLILKMNRRIVRNLLGDKLEVFVPTQQLMHLGYKFNFHTHSKLVNKNPEKFANCIYEFALEIINNEQYKIYRYGK